MKYNWFSTSSTRNALILPLVKSARYLKAPLFSGYSHWLTGDMSKTILSNWAAHEPHNYQARRSGWSGYHQTNLLATNKRFLPWRTCVPAMKLPDQSKTASGGTDYSTGLS